VEDDEMERNANESMNASGAGQSDAGQSGAGQTGAGASGGSMSGGSFGGSAVGSAAGSQGYAGSAGGAGGMGGMGAGAGTDTGAGRMDSAKQAVTDKLGTVKEKASNLTATLADRLEAGAEKLRQRGQTQQFAGAGGETMSGQNEQLNALSNRLAGGMQGTADFLRNGDLKASVEQQVRENPARTLLIAVGVGYLLGKAIRR
jgi:hypothetical protein